jgi:hypothetical protein
MIKNYLEKRKNDREQIYKFYLSHKEGVDNLEYGRILRFYDIEFYRFVDWTYCALFDGITGFIITDCRLTDLIEEFGS